MASVTLANVSVPPPSDNNDKLHCSNGALTGPHGLLVQALLAIVAFGALVGEFFTLGHDFILTFFFQCR